MRSGQRKEIKKRERKEKIKKRKKNKKIQARRGAGKDRKWKKEKYRKFAQKNAQAIE